MDKNNFLQDYIQVNERIIKFYEKHPEGSIQTQILSIDTEKVVIKAFVYRNKEDLIPSTGHAEEIRNSNYINRTSAVENCETSAVGRALANLGFEIRHSIASREEVEQAINKHEFIEQNDLATLKKNVFKNAKSKGLTDVEFKSICENITNKKSSKDWSTSDLKNITSYINTYSTH